MNRLFYIIYNSYYKHGEYKDDIPSLTVGGIFTIIFSCIGLSIKNIIGWIDPAYYQIKFEKPNSFLLIILYGSIVYFLFYHQKKYQKIYNTYRENIFLNSKLAKYLGFSIVILLILLPFILALIQNKILRGYWV